MSSSLRIVHTPPMGVRETENNKALSAYIARANRAINQSRRLTEAAQKLTTRAMSTTPDAKRQELAAEVKQILGEVLMQLTNESSLTGVHNA